MLHVSYQVSPYGSTRSATNARKIAPPFGASQFMFQICIRGIANKTLHHRVQHSQPARNTRSNYIDYYHQRKQKSFFHKCEVVKKFLEERSIFVLVWRTYRRTRVERELIYITGCINIVIKISNIEKGNFVEPRDDLLHSYAAYLQHSCKHYTAYDYGNNNKCADGNVTRKWIKKITLR